MATNKLFPKPSMATSNPLYNHLFRLFPQPGIEIESLLVKNLYLFIIRMIAIQNENIGGMNDAAWYF